jgi:hypothetical protein
VANYIDYQIDVVKNSWTVATSATAGIATATKAAAPGVVHVITKVDLSYSGSTQSGLATVNFGTVAQGTKYIHGAGAIDFGVLGLQNPTANQLVEVVLAAGAGGIVGTIIMTGYTTGLNA